MGPLPERLLRLEEPPQQGGGEGPAPDADAPCPGVRLGLAELSGEGEAGLSPGDELRVGVEVTEQGPLAQGGGAGHDGKVAPADLLRGLKNSNLILCRLPTPKMDRNSKKQKHIQSNQFSTLTLKINFQLLLANIVTHGLHREDARHSQEGRILRGRRPEQRAALGAAAVEVRPPGKLRQKGEEVSNVAAVGCLLVQQKIELVARFGVESAEKEKQRKNARLY